jgi:hypothetical protein
MPLNSPQLGPDGAHYVKTYVQDAPGTATEIIHNYGKVPTSITPVWSNKAINYPEIVSSTKEKTILKFLPEWITAYTGKSFVVIMRFA